MLEGEGDSKSHSRVLMMLKGGTAPFQNETGQWRGIPREERMCRECEEYMRKWKTATIGCYGVLGGRQIDSFS